jgi:hypothetical protein
VVPCDRPERLVAIDGASRKIDVELGPTEFEALVFFVNDKRVTNSHVEFAAANYDGAGVEFELSCC